MANKKEIPSLDLNYTDGEILYAQPLNKTTQKINDIIEEINKRADPWEDFK